MLAHKNTQVFKSLADGLLRLACNKCCERTWGHLPRVHMPWFNVQGSVHRKCITFDIFPTRCNFTQFFLENCSTCFGWYLHPSSGAHTTVFTVSDTCQIVTATATTVELVLVWCGNCTVLVQLLTYVSNCIYYCHFSWKADEKACHRRWSLKKARHRKYNVTIRRVIATILAVEM